MPFHHEALGPLPVDTLPDATSSAPVPATGVLLCLSTAPASPLDIFMFHDLSSWQGRGGINGACRRSRGRSGRLDHGLRVASAAPQRGPDHCRDPRSHLSFRALQPVGGGGLADAQPYQRRSGADDAAARDRLSDGARHAPRAGREPGGARRRHCARLRLPRGGDRPRACLRRDRGLRTRGPHPVHLPCRPCRGRPCGLRAVLRKPRPHRGGGGAGRELLRARLRIRLHPRCGPAPTQDPRPGAHDLRHLRTLYRPSWPRRGGRHQGAARIRAAQPPYQMDHLGPDLAGRGGDDACRGSGRRRRHEAPCPALRLCDDAACLPGG